MELKTLKSISSKISGVRLNTKELGFMKYVCLENFDNGSKNSDGSSLVFKRGDEYKGAMDEKELEILLEKKLIKKADAEAPKDPPKVESVELEKLSKKDLMKMAEEKGLEVDKNISKEDLVALLKGA